MTDYEAVKAIALIMEDFYRGALNSFEALNEVAQVIGANKILHEATP
jgi:hypothetical protein